MSLWTKIRNTITKPLKRLQDWLIPTQEQPGLLIEKSGTNNPYKVVYGTKTVPAVKIFKMTSNVSGGAKNEYLHLICVFCEGEVDAIEELYFGDIPSKEIDSKKYYIEKFLGSDDQPHCATLTDAIPAWKSTATLNGLCYAYVRLKINKNLDWWQGEPEIKARIRGRKVKDIRTGVIEYSENPSLILWDYLTNRRFGKKTPESELHLASFQAAAHYCDEGETFTRNTYSYEYDREHDRTITTKTGQETITQPRMSCNFLLDTNKKLLDNVKEIRSGCRGLITPSEDGIRFNIEKGGPSLYSFDASNLRDEKITSKAGSKGEYHNRVTVRYPSDQILGQYDEISWPEKESDIYAQWLAEDKNIPLDGSYDFPTINNAAEALQMAEVACRRSRYQRQVKIPAQPWAIEPEPGDIVDLTDPTHGYEKKAFRIIEKQVKVDGNVDYDVIEHQDSIYVWSIDVSNEYYPNTSLALANDILKPTGLSFAGAKDDSSILGVLTWSDPDNVMVVNHHVEVTDTDSGGIIFSQETNLLRMEIPRFSAGSYSASVTARNAFFISDSANLLLVAAAPKVPNGLTISAGNFELVLTPTIDGSPGTLLFDLKVSTDTEIANATVLGRARSFTDNDLAPNTSRYYWARSINSTGESAWSEMFTGKTTNDNTNLVEFLSDLGPANFAPEVRSLLDQVSDITVDETLPVVIEQIRNDLSTAKTAINNVRIDEASILDLQSTYQQLGLDFLSSQEDNSSAFSDMIEKFADTNQFVSEINEQLGQILVEGGKVSYDQFVNYQLLVDTLNGSLSSIINQVTNSESGLSAAHSKINQNIEKIELVLGNTDAAELFTLAKQVSVNLDRLTNTITQQSFALKFDEWAQFQQALSGELQLSELLENNIDFAIAQEKTASDVDEVKAEASSTKLLVASFNEQLTKATSTFATNEHVLSSAKRTEAEVTKQLRSEIADETSARESAISQTQQTVADEASTIATNINELNSRVADETSARESAISQTQQTVADEASTRALAVNELNSRVDDETSARESAISQTQQTVTDEASTRALAVNELNSRIEDETSARESAISQTQQTVTDEASTRATAINNLKSTINDPQTGLAKAHSEITDTRQTLGNEIDGISDATAALKARVVNEEEKSASAIIVLNAHNEAIGELKGKVFLGLDINGRVSGLLIEGSETLTEIDIAADKISFVNPDTDEKDLSYNADKKRLEFGGALKVGTLIQSPKIEFIGNTHTRISSATGFGSNNQFIEWFGPSMMAGGGINYAALTESNAITYLKTDGTAYFGGSIISGALSNSLTTSDLSNTAQVQIGPYGSNGGTIAINCSVSMASILSAVQSNQGTKPAIPSCKILLEELVNNVWVSRQLASFTGSSSIENNYEGNGEYYVEARQELSGSFTYTDNKNSISDRVYRVRLTQRSSFFTLGQWSARQRISINSQEG